MLIDLIAGARPNFMKIAPLVHAIQKAKAGGAKIAFRLIHTGQHYDKNMSDSFLSNSKFRHLISIWVREVVRKRSKQLPL